MRKFILSLLLFFGNHFLNAQVQWASQVLNVSSEASVELSRHQYRANQVLGKPNILPQIGILHPCGWVPDKTDYQATITVAFENPLKIRQVAIAQNFFGGAITKLWISDKKNRSYLIYETSPITPRTQGGMLRIFLQELTSFKVYSVKIEMDGSDRYGLTCIDAIGISSEIHPIEAQINLVPNNPNDSISTVYIENLGSTINTPYEEIMPVISPDGRRLYFDRKNHPENIGADSSKKHNDDIWYADRQENGQFVPPIHMKPPLNNDSHNYVCSVSPDGNTLLLGNKYVRNTCVAGLSISRQIEKNGEKIWSFPQEVKIDDYYNLNRFGEFYLAHNQKTLLLAIQRHDTQGDRDLYVSFLKEDGNWTRPKHLGTQINSAGSEMTPFLAADDKTLYFSSNGFSGYGDADMFVTRRLDDSWTNWTEPLNLGLEFNSSEWDASYSIDAAGEYAYFVSYENSTSKSADIFRAKLPQPVKPEPVVLVYGKVLNQNTKQPISAQISYEILPDGKEVGTAVSDPKTGDYKIVLPLHQNYGFWANAKGYLSVNEHLNLVDSSAYLEIQQDLFLTPIQVGQLVRLNNIFFEQNKADLTPESFPELNRIAKILTENPTVVIQIEGHTDLGGNATKMLKLSDKRVHSVKNYLVAQNIDTERIKTKAYGLQKPLFSSKNPKNRRVEFTVLKD